MNNIPKKVVEFKVVEFQTKKTPELLYTAFSKTPYSALLTGNSKKDVSHYSFIGLNPLHVYISDNSTTDPFDEFNKLIRHYNVDNLSYPANLWGGIGYISYNAAKYIEKIPQTVKNDLLMPDMQMVFYKDMIIFDHLLKKQFVVQARISGGKFSDVEEILNTKVQNNKKYKIQEKIECCDKALYKNKINKIKDYIIDGDVYEVNLSHRCSVPYFGDEYSIFRKLYKINSAPFSAFMPFGSHTIISNSPERFIFADGNKIETRPIKGTLPRGKNKIQDQKYKNMLLKSKKDDAELSMIVDLLRNDFGKVCEYGSVKVRNHKMIEKYKNVWHLVSIIEGTLKNDYSYGELIKACFPGGSITGCPKIRSMEIIDELEEYSRNIYTGTIFIANSKRIDTNIVIRTIIAHENQLYFNIGGAIVYDSDPENEYKETKIKASSIVKALI